MQVNVRIFGIATANHKLTESNLMIL